MKPVPMAINPPFARLAELGPDGKIKRVDGILDVLAIQRNKLVDEATREKIRPNIANLQAFVREKQSCRYTIEWQRFAKKHIVHSTSAINLDLQPRVFASPKLVNTVSDNIRRTPEFVRNNSFRSLWVDPENYFGWIQ